MLFRMEIGQARTPNNGPQAKNVSFADLLDDDVITKGSPINTDQSINVTVPDFHTIDPVDEPIDDLIEKIHLIDNPTTHPSLTLVNRPFDLDVEQCQKILIQRLVDFTKMAELRGSVMWDYTRSCKLNSGSPR